MITYKEFAKKSDWEANIDLDFELPGTTDLELMVDECALYESDSISIHQAHDPELEATVLLIQSSTGYSCIVPHGTDEDRQKIIGLGYGVYSKFIDAGIIDLDYIGLTKRAQMLINNSLDWYVVTLKNEDIELMHSSALSSILECGEDMIQYGYTDIERCWNGEDLSDSGDWI